MPRFRSMPEVLRDGRWLAPGRVRFVLWAMLIASSVALLALVLTARHGVDLQGRPLGTDFSEFYAAGTLVRAGEPAAPYDPVQEQARERALFGDATPFYPWHYPPFFLLIAGLLAALPYGPALLVWLAATLVAYLAALRTIVAGCDGCDRIWWLAALAFPAVLLNAGHGQNGFLTAALMAGALAVLDRRPVLAGILFGLLAYKPHFGLLIPLVLAVTGRWRTIAAAAATVLLLVAAVTLAFGSGIWEAFLASTHFTRIVALEQGGTGWHKIQTVFAWARMWGASVPTAYALQAMASMTLVAATAWLWRSRAPYGHKAAALCIATILVSPYSLDYDMMLLAPAIAFAAAEGLRHGFAPWEKTAFAVLWLVPVLARPVAAATLVPLGVPIMAAALVVMLRRAWPGEEKDPSALSVPVRS